LVMNGEKKYERGSSYQRIFKCRAARVNTVASPRPTTNKVHHTSAYDTVQNTIHRSKHFRLWVQNEMQGGSPLELVVRCHGASLLFGDTIVGVIHTSERGAVRKTETKERCQHISPLNCCSVSYFEPVPCNTQRAVHTSACETVGEILQGAPHLPW
jgi:hypothetical protein